jgi:hypothetical protein
MPYSASESDHGPGSDDGAVVGAAVGAEGCVTEEEEDRVADDAGALFGACGPQATNVTASVATRPTLYGQNLASFANFTVSLRANSLMGNNVTRQHRTFSREPPPLPKFPKVALPNHPCMRSWVRRNKAPSRGAGACGCVCSARKIAHGAAAALVANYPRHGRHVQRLLLLCQRKSIAR